MKSYSLSHLADHVLLRGLAALITQDRGTTAALLAHLAEVDARKLYLPAAYPSMYLYCVHELHLSEDAAWKRIQAARAARQFPDIFAALADGRLHLSAVVLLAPHLRPDTAEELLALATHKTKAALALLLAQRFPRPDVPTLVQAVAPMVTASQPAPGQVAELVGPCVVAPVEPPGPVPAPANVAERAGQPAPAQVTDVAGQPAPAPFVPRARLAPLAPGRFALRTRATSPPQFVASSGSATAVNARS